LGTVERERDAVKALVGELIDRWVDE